MVTLTAFSQAYWQAMFRSRGWVHEVQINMHPDWMSSGLYKHSISGLALGMKLNPRTLWGLQRTL